MTEALGGTAGRHMRAEIAEQPARWRDVLDQQAGQLQEASDLLSADSINSVFLLGRGTSDHAAIYGQYLCQATLGRRAALATPSVTSLMERDLFDPTTLVVAVSQSGASPDLVATLDSARRTGAPTVSFTNAADSPLARASDVHVDVCAGEEKSVAATKSYTSELVALFAWVRLAGGQPFSELHRDVDAVADAATVLVERATTSAREMAEDLKEDDRILVVGRGYSLSTAKEAALKLIETCAIAASGWSAADAKHGPLGQVVRGTPVFLLSSSTYGRQSVLLLASDVRARGGRAYVVGADSTAAPPDQPFAALLPHVPDPLVPMLEIIPFQLLALELALLRAADPDRPIGLTKVTHTL